MIDRPHAVRLVARFENQPFWNLLSDDAVQELVKAFASAQTLDQATEAADWLLQYGEDRLTTQQIYGRLRETPAQTYVPRDQKCPHCHGAGLRSVYLVEVEGFPRPPGGKTKCKRVHCGVCPPQQCLATSGRDYEWACVDRAKAEQRVIIEASEPCPACRYGQSRGLAYADREAEQQAKMEKRRKGE